MIILHVRQFYYLHVDRSPKIQQRRSSLCLPRPGRQVQGGVPGHVHLVQVHPLLGHLLAQPPGDPVLEK